MKKLNNKGYMLIEIILAFVLAMGITYFMTELVIKLKNKNDDLLVKTLVSTDQAIIYNTIMNDIYKNGKESFSCDKIKIDGNKFVYNGETISLVSEYADVQFDSSNTTYCDDSGDEIKIKMPINVKQLPSDDFDVLIGLDDADDGNNGSSVVSCSLELTSDNEIVASTDFAGNIVYQGFSSTYGGESVTTKTISSSGTYTYYIKAKSGLEGKCSIKVVDTETSKSCPSAYPHWDGSKCYYTTYDGVTKKCNCYSNEGYTKTLTGSAYTVSAEVCKNNCANYYNNFTSSISATCSKGTAFLLATGGYACKITTSTKRTTTYSCPGGYSNKANDSYCWKKVE